MSLLIAVTTGFVVGIIAGILGIGGGAFLIAALVLFLGVGQHMAQGVSLAVIVLTALVGTYTHYRQNNIDLRTALMVSPAAVLFGVVSANVAGLLPEDLLQKLFALLLVYLGIHMIWRR